MRDDGRKYLYCGKSLFQITVQNSENRIGIHIKTSNFFLTILTKDRNKSSLTLSNYIISFKYFFYPKCESIL